MVRWDDLKANAKETFEEFKKHKIGWVGVSLVLFVVIIGILAPVLAPGAQEDWGVGNPRWRANPSTAPPVWYDWITRDDYQRHEVVEWDEEDEEAFDVFPSRIGSLGEFDAELEPDEFYHDYGFRETGEVNVSLHHDDLDIPLEEETIDVTPRDPIPDVTVRDFNVTPTEGIAPLDVEVEAILEHEGNILEDHREAPLEIGDEEYIFELGPVEVFDLNYTDYGEYIQEDEISSELRDAFMERNFDVASDAVLEEEEDLWWDWAVFENDDEAYLIEIDENGEDDEGKIIVYEPRDAADVFVVHTVELDGMYSVTLGDQWEIIEIGTDVTVVEFEVALVDGIVQIDATVENLNLEEDQRIILTQYLEYRIREDDEQEEVDEYTTVEEWVIGPGERETIAFEHPLEEEGQYTFFFGEESRRVNYREVDDDGAAASLAGAEYETQNEGGELLEEAPQLQDEVGGVEVIDFDVPSIIELGEVYRINAHLRNLEEYEKNVSIRIEDEPVREAVLTRTGDYRGYRHTIQFDMDSDVPPTEIFFEYSGWAEVYTRRYIYVERPCEDVPEMVLEVDRRGDRTGEFSESVTTARRWQVRERIYDEARRQMIREGRDAEEIGDETEFDPVETVFSKATASWMDDPEPLNGQYNFTIQIEAADVEMDEAQITFGGAVFGVLGTDSYRRDIFQGWVWGARWGIIIGGLVAITAISLGTVFGMTSAYYGGWVDEFMQRINEIVMGIPTFPILVVTLEFLDTPSIWMFTFIYVLLSWRGIAKVVRARGLQVAKETYVEAAESLGAGSGRVIMSHMVPQILPYSIATGAMLVPVAIMAEAGLHMLGLGDPRVITWGTMLEEAYGSGAILNPSASWFWVLFPGLGMLIVGFGFISAGMAIERIINPKMRQR